jgi:hypothetical protein
MSHNVDCWQLISPSIYSAEQFYFFLFKPGKEIFDCAADARKPLSSYGKAMLDRE